jgi:hypothetical protein
MPGVDGQAVWLQGRISKVLARKPHWHNHFLEFSQGKGRIHTSLLFWMDYLRLGHLTGSAGTEHLASPSVYEGNRTMISILQRSEPPQGYGTHFWEAFVNVILKEVNNTIRAACRMPEEKKQTYSFG